MSPDARFSPGCLDHPDSTQTCRSRSRVASEQAKLNLLAIENSFLLANVDRSLRKPGYFRFLNSGPP